MARHASISGDETTSSWTMRPEILSTPALGWDVKTDVCIIGAGIAGISTGYMLAREGLSVTVVSDGPIGGGQTYRTSAHLASVLDHRYAEIERLHGKAAARAAAESHTLAISQIAAISRMEGIDCDFQHVDGYLFSAPGRNLQDLSEELAAARRAGLSSVDFVRRAPLHFFDTGRCLRFPAQAQFHPMKYLSGLAAALMKHGGQIYGEAHVTRVEDGDPCRVETANGTIFSGAVVVATNTPVNDRVTMHTKQAAYRSYVIGARIPRGSVERALYWDSEDPYHYVRTQPMPGSRQDAPTDLLIVGGEDHKTGQMPGVDPFKKLQQWAERRFPMIEDVDYKWSGQILEPVDGLAFIGRNPGGDKNIYIATGHSGNGLTYGTITGMLLRDLIFGRENPWAEFYDPARKSLRAAKTFTAENLNVVAQYADWLRGGTVSSRAGIPRGSGAVLSRGLKKVAVYRDLDGSYCEKSAKCPHLGCIVHWNKVERTWDCPCHGSRFDPYGRVINGPAVGDLEQAIEQPAPPRPQHVEEEVRRAG